MIFKVSKYKIGPNMLVHCLRYLIFFFIICLICVIKHAFFVHTGCLILLATPKFSYVQRQVEKDASPNTSGSVQGSYSGLLQLPPAPNQLPHTFSNTLQKPPTLLPFKHPSHRGSVFTPLPQKLCPTGSVWRASGKPPCPAPRAPQL